MPVLYPGRYAATIEGPYVVFLIGLRVNRLLALNKWIPVANAMGPMIRELYANPSLGFLHAQPSVYWRGVMLTQYWRSFDHLVDYAQSRDAKHLPAWKAFNQSVGTDGSVGVWHETYKVANGQSECIYVNMPRFGLAVAGSHEQATGHLRDARTRMQGESAPPSSGPS
jgi:Domain of unknown function (DUF4188)